MKTPKNHKTNNHRAKTHKKRGHSPQMMGACVTHLLEFLIIVKLYHWRTSSFAQHKATDELYASLNENIDKFVEVLLGKSSGMRITVPPVFHITAHNYTHKSHFVGEIEKFRGYLSDMENHPEVGNRTDLLSIRDDILADVNKFLYLMSFS